MTLKANERFNGIYHWVLPICFKIYTLQDVNNIMVDFSKTARAAAIWALYKKKKKNGTKLSK